MENVIIGYTKPKDHAERTGKGHILSGAEFGFRVEGDQNGVPVGKPGSWWMDLTSSR